MKRQRQTETTQTARTSPASTAKTTSTSAARAPDDREVIGNKNSKKYHPLACPGYSQVGEKNRVMFKSAAEAEAAGYTKARNCKKE